MKTLNRICIKDHNCEFEDGSSIKFERGAEYTTSETNEDDTVTVFSSYWVGGVPVSIFAGEEVLTNG